MKTCEVCSIKIDPRSTYCVKCRANLKPIAFFAMKTHSEETKKKMSVSGKKRFTEEYKEKVYREKCRGTKKLSALGYVLVKNYDHPNRSKVNQIREHVLVMSNFINRKLEKGEVVHHINLKKDDNQIENLYLFSNNKLHMQAHHSLNQLVPELLKAGVVEFKSGKYQLSKHISSSLKNMNLKNELHTTDNHNSENKQK